MECRAVQTKEREIPRLCTSSLEARSLSSGGVSLPVPTGSSEAEQKVGEGGCVSQVPLWVELCPA